MKEDEMVGRHYGLNGHQFEEAPGDGERQGTLACCSPWGRKELDMTERLNNTTPFFNFCFYCLPFEVRSKKIITKNEIKELAAYAFLQELYDFKSSIQVFNPF